MQITKERGLSLKGTLYKVNVKEPNANMIKPGRKNAKLGHRVQTKKWQNCVIYQLTLEERSTCPTDCNQWSNCYGNNMPFAHRHNHESPDFLPLLDRQLDQLARKHRDGFVVRLHVLGDFYSTAYVKFWQDQLHKHPALKVFGYTHRQRTTDIGSLIYDLNLKFPDQCQIRFSDSTELFAANVISEYREPNANEIVCPQQLSKTATCATCGLCWSQGQRQILFLQH